jgi:steroid delta-isomerase-like uncharacterized protein
MTSDHIKAFRQFIDDAPNAGRLDAVAKIMSPDVRYHLPDGSEPLKGVDAVKAAISGFRAAFSDLHIRVDNIFGSGDQIAARVTVSGTHDGELMGFAPTGRRVEWAAVHLSRFEGERIVEDRIFFDQFSMLAKLGLIDSPSNA